MDGGTADDLLTARCHCGEVTIRLPRKPDYVNQCNCSLCAKTGFMGIYFGSDELVIDGKVDGYVRTDIKEPMLRNLRCTNCGMPTHWEPLSEPPHERMGVNARMVDPRLLDGVEIRQVDGASWDS